MYIDTIFGIKWRASIAPVEIFYLILILVLALIIFLLFRYNLKQKDKILQAKLLFEFKIKQFGLSGLQIRILNHIIQLHKLKNPRIILNSPHLFEDSIGDLLLYLKDSTEDSESLVNIWKDLIITYEKLYHHTIIRKPIEKISDIEEGMLLYFFMDPSVVYIGKLVEKLETKMTLMLFRNPGELPRIETNSTYNFYFWRSGDAEYIFASTVLSHNEGHIIINMPSEFTRGKEVRRPYVDVIIPCTILLSDPSYHSAELEPEPIYATILKLNEHEIVLRGEQKLDYRYTYRLDFEIDEFKVDTLVSVIAEKIITEGNVHYHTCKIMEISEPARALLRKFIIERF